MSTLQTERAARSFDAQLSNVCDLVKIGLGHEPAERQTVLLSTTHAASDGEIWQLSVTTTPPGESHKSQIA